MISLWESGERWSRATRPAKRFLYALHHLEKLRTRQPEIAGLMAFIYHDFDIWEQFRCVLHFVNEQRRLIQLKEHLWVRLGEFRSVRSSKETFCPFALDLYQMFQHGSFSNLPWAGKQKHRILFIQLHHRFLHVSGDIHRRSSFLDFG